MERNVARDAERTTQFVPVPDVATLKPWLSGPGQSILFLHDPNCPTSLRAYAEPAKIGGEIALIDVRHTRAVSGQIEARTGVRHESPQVIVLEDGRVVWLASHRAITTAAVVCASGIGRP